jgi:GTP:adenosylcobinamide-phosphate guanylyltransferase
MLNSLKNPAYPYLSTGVIPRRFLSPFVVALTDLPPRAPKVINKIINYCIGLYCIVLTACTVAASFAKIQLSTMNLINARLFDPLKL